MAALPTGRRQTIQPVDNGFKIQKYWYASDGKPIDLTNGVLEARQGDLFTVLLDIQATHDTQNDDMLLTDLLPAGVDIEGSLISPPRVFFEDGGFIFLDFLKCKVFILRILATYCAIIIKLCESCLLYTSPSPRDS